MEREIIQIKSIMENDKFKNPFEEWKNFRVFTVDTLKFGINNCLKNIKKSDIEALRIQTPDFENHQGDLKVIWLGHSTILIQDNHINLLFDPIFSKSISKIMGYDRLVRLPCKFEDLPEIHGILISHDHFDHCDIEAIQFLQNRWHPQYFIGLNSKDILPRNRKDSVFQLDWWQQVKIAFKGNREYKIKFVPACHWSGRGITDIYKRLWGGFVLTTPDNYVIYFAGDTGKCDVFRQIGMQHQIDLALLPIGAYEPNDFLSPQHINPEQAVIIHKQINANLSIGIHWGTYKLSNEDFLQPREDLIKALQKHKVIKEKFLTVNQGQSILLQSKKNFSSKKNLKKFQIINYQYKTFSLEDQHSLFMFNVGYSLENLVENKKLSQKIQQMTMFKNSLNVIILLEEVDQIILTKYIDKKILILSPFEYDCSIKNIYKMVPYMKLQLTFQTKTFEIFYIPQGCLIKNSQNCFIWIAKQQTHYQIRKLLNRYVEKNPIFEFPKQYYFNRIKIKYQNIANINFDQIKIHISLIPCRNMESIQKSQDYEKQKKNILNCLESYINQLKAEKVYIILECQQFVLSKMLKQQLSKNAQPRMI